ncbi:MAG: hypothetical protein ACLF0P_11275, partial [Thermoanaerobaculia bacterium]
MALLLAFGGAAPATAQEGSPSAQVSAAAEAETAAELRERVEAAFEVLPFRGGLLLRPREDYRGIRTVE